MGVVEGSRWGSGITARVWGSRIGVISGVRGKGTGVRTVTDHYKGDNFLQLRKFPVFVFSKSVNYFSILLAVVFIQNIISGVIVVNRRIYI